MSTTAASTKDSSESTDKRDGQPQALLTVNHAMARAVGDFSALLSPVTVTSFWIHSIQWTSGMTGSDVGCMTTMRSNNKAKVRFDPRSTKQRRMTRHVFSVRLSLKGDPLERA
jgi:hypothetical protein